MENPYKNVWGLTGIIGSGKSTAAQMFQSLGAEVISADELAREVVKLDSPFYQEIRCKLEKEFFFSFGNIFLPNGELNRAYLAEIAFSSQANTKKLNEIFHPPIAKLFQEKIKNIPKEKLIIYDVPLLFETGLEKKLKGVIVVSCSEDKALERVLQKRGFSKEQFYKRLAQQIPLKEKRKLADYVIDNNGSKEELFCQVKALYAKLNLR